jgi:hypothetical protein
MRIFENSHMSIWDQIAGAVVRSATSHTIGALMRGQGLLVVIVIAVVLVGGVLALKHFRIF